MKKGFTLIELLGVIVILSVLATVSTILVLKIVNDQKTKVLNEEIKNVKDSAMTYVIDKKISLESCSSSFDPKASSFSTTDAMCFTKVLISDLVKNNFFENKNKVCNENGYIIVYKIGSGLTTELNSYMADGVCK